MKLFLPDFSEHGKTTVAVMLGVNAAFVSIMGYTGIKIVQYVSEFVEKHVN